MIDYKRITWCPGCTNFGILTAFTKAIQELINEGKIEKKDIVVLGGIGCAGKLPDYLKLNSFIGLHGRALASGIGIKLANPELKVIIFQGDGDTYNEGLEHFISACKENPDVTLIVHNNKTFALTTGQHTFTTEPGFKSRSLGQEVFTKPLNPIALALVSGATFVARGYALWIDHLKELIKEAILHRGFSFIDVLQPCISFHDTRKFYEERMYKLEESNHDYTNFDEALKKALEWDYTLNPNARIPIGIFYKTERKTLEKGLKAKNVLKIVRSLNWDVLNYVKVP